MNVVQYLVTNTYCHVTSDQAFYPDELFFPNMSAKIFGMDYIKTEADI